MLHLHPRERTEPEERPREGRRSRAGDRSGKERPIVTEAEAVLVFCLVWAAIVGPALVLKYWDELMH